MLGLLALLPACAEGAAAPLDRPLAQILALPPDAEHGRVLYLKHCVPCHGGHAWGDGPRGIPALAGQRPFYLIKQLASFATARRAGDSMHEVMRRQDLDWPQAVRDLAAHLSQARRNPDPEHADIHDPFGAQGLYQGRCASCHGRNGESAEEAIVPALGGQHYRYLRQRIGSFGLVHQGQVDETLTGLVHRLSGDQQFAVSDYISRLTYLTAASAP